MSKLYPFVFLITYACQIVELRAPNEAEVRQWEYLTECMERIEPGISQGVEMPAWVAIVKDLECNPGQRALGCLFGNIVAINAGILEWEWKPQEFFMAQWIHESKHKVLCDRGDCDVGHDSIWFDSVRTGADGKLYSYKAPCSDWPE
jgi:hypothetical protein